MKKMHKSKVGVAPFSLTKIFDDPSSGKINSCFFNGTIQIILKTTLSEKDKEDLLSLLTILCMKIASLWEIKEKYNSVLKDLKNELKKDPKAGNNNLHSYSIQATSLLGWFDVFLVQVKSILDHLVKVPSPVFGYKRWSLASFGDRGKKVKKAFDNLPNKYKKMTNNYYEVIFGSHHWIEDAIEIRDKLNHGVRGGLDPKLFTVSYIEEINKFIEPMWSEDQTIENAQEHIFSSVLNLCSLFCAVILSVKLPDDLTVICNYEAQKNKDPICKVISKVALKKHLESHGITDHGLG